MFERLKTECRKLGCHRAVHGGLFATYGAGLAGVETALVYGAATLLYAVLMVRG